MDNYYIAKPGVRKEIGNIPHINFLFDCILIILMNLNMIKTMVFRDIKVRYKGSFLGLMWLVSNPLALMITYGFVFAGIFKMRVSNSSNLAETMIAIWMCISIWQTMSETISRSCSLMFDSAPIVKRSSFPLSILIISSTITPYLGFLISFTMIICIAIYLFHQIFLSWIFIPIFMIPIFLITLGLAYLSSILGTYIRDIKHIMPIALNMAMMLSPIMYSINSIPDKIKFIAYYNPLTFLFENIRNAILGINNFDWITLLIYIIFSWLFCSISYFSFKKISPYFADVL